MQTPFEKVLAERERLRREAMDLFVPMSVFNSRFESGDYRKTPQYRQSGGS